MHQHPFFRRVLALLTGSSPSTASKIANHNTGPFDSDHRLVSFSPFDPWTWRDAYAGTCILGSVGAGKTSGSGQKIARAMLATGAGGIVLCAKPDEVQTWRKYAREAGREDDLIEVTAQGEFRFNFLDYENSRESAGGGLTENIVQLLLTAGEAGGQSGSSGGGQSNDPYWRQAAAEMLSHAIDLLRMGRPRLVLAELDAFIRSAAKSLEQANDEEWMKKSFCAQVQLEADRVLPKEGPERDDLNVASAYWQAQWSDLDPKQRGGILGQYSAVAKALQKSPLRELLCSDTTFTPDDCRKGKILVINLPTLQFHGAGKVVQVLLKTCFQRAMQAQGESADLRPVFLWADEAQHFLTAADQEFLTTARSSRVATVLLTQSVSNFLSVLGDSRRATVDSLLGNLRTQIFHSQSDAKTNEWAANWFGKAWRTRQGYSMSSGERDGSAAGSNHSQSVSGHQSNDYLVEPGAFSTLACGGPDYGYVVEAIVGQGGRVWNANGQKFLRVAFEQQVAKE